MQKVRRLHETLHSLDGIRAPQNKRTVFVASADEAKAEVCAGGDAMQANEGKHNSGARVPRKLIAKFERQRTAKLTELTERTKRHAKLANTVQRLSIDRALQGKVRGGRTRPLREAFHPLRDQRNVSGTNEIGEKAGALLHFRHDSGS